MRARMALLYTKVTWQHREILLKDKPQAMLDASPKGTVPVLVLEDGEVIDESLDIMHWALDQTDPDNWLMASQPDQNRMLDLIMQFDQQFKPLLDRYKYPTRFPDEDVSQAREHATKWLNKLERQLNSGPHLFGKHVSLADVAIFPFVRQFAHTDKTWFRAEPWRALICWLDTWLDAPLFRQCMKKYKPWQPDPLEAMLNTN